MVKVKTENLSITFYVLLLFNKNVVILFTERDYDERDLNVWSDSMLHAWDQVSFSDTESDEEELPHEIPQPLFHDRDLNRRLDREALNRVNRYFERDFDLAGNCYLTGMLKRLQLTCKLMYLRF